MTEKPIQQFKGFPAGKNGSIQVPNSFFSSLLPLIDDLAELKLTVYCFWALQQREGKYRYVRRRELLADETLLASLGDDPNSAEKTLQSALDRATERGTLLHVVLPGSQDDDHLYFMNTDKGRKAIEALENGDWIPGAFDQPLGSILERPNIFALYEQNIGPLTPLLSDILRDAEKTYPDAWIGEAMKIAIENNKRSWKYIEAILKRWTLEGKPNDIAQTESVNGEKNPYLQHEYFRRREKTSDDE
jgi:DNA replication protein